ncbi:MAG: hypothetical protein HC803_06465, partial [Saprospiraceae bacterium]|nr:hypothetical protein [Saprospiraceae bacterium]
MKKIIILLSLLILVFIGVSAFQHKDNSAENWNEKSTVSEVLFDLGD